MIIDAHTHMPSEGWPKHSPSIKTVAGAVEYLRQAGTDAALFNTWQGVHATTDEDLDQANAAALALARQFDGFLYPGASVHPLMPKTSLAWLKRFRDEGYLWVGELVNYTKPYKYSDAAFLELCEEIAAHGHILQLHNHADILVVARRFPKMQIVASHINASLCPQFAAEPNVWLDISGGTGGLAMGAIEAAYKAFGPDRILYGTDFTGYEPRCFQLRLELAIADAAVREKILWKNVVRVIDASGSKPIVARPR